MIDILVVDDHEIVREGLSSSLSSDTSRVVAAVGSGEEALTALTQQPIDVIVVDLRLPDMSGHELIGMIRQRHSDVKIIVLSTYLSEESVRLSRELGADAYVAKSAGMSELRAALVRVLSGHSITETPATLVRRQRGTTDIRLTPQQEKVLTLAADGATDREIASALFLSESTVRFHIQRIRVLLGARSKTQMIAEAIRRELIRPEPLLCRSTSRFR